MEKLGRGLGVVLIDDNDGDLWRSGTVAGVNHGEDGEEDDGEQEAESERKAVAAEADEGDAGDVEELWHISRAAPFR